MFILKVSERKRKKNLLYVYFKSTGEKRKKNLLDVIFKSIREKRKRILYYKILEVNLVVKKWDPLGPISYKDLD